MLKVGSLHIENPLVLAPMAGFTDTCARRLARRFGAGLVYSEMISAAGLARRQPRAHEMLAFHSEEQPYGVQIFGADPAEMAEAARIAQNEGASVVDINLGCPVKRVCRTGAGAALLREPKRVDTILAAVRKAVTCALTVKMRLGWDAKELTVFETSRIAEDRGVDAIALHPRTRAEGFQGKADWSFITRLKAERKIPVIGNGDLFGPRMCLDALRGSGCDGIMIGRAARGNPWIFSQALDLLSGKDPIELSPEMRYGTIRLHMDWLCTRYGTQQGLRKMRFLLFHYGRGLRGAAWFRRQLASVQGEEALEELLRTFFLESRAPS